MVNDMIYLYAKLYERGFLGEDEYIQLLGELQLDPKTINVILATENKHKREVRRERERNDNAMRRKSLSDSQ